MRLKRKVMAGMTAAALVVSSLSIAATAGPKFSGSKADDGLEILTGSYRADYYPDFGDRPLQIANDFHLFAFDSITLYAHCNGNFAAPYVNAMQANGSNQYGDADSENDANNGNNLIDSSELSIATKKLEISGSTLVTDLLIPLGVSVTDANGEFTKSNPIEGQLKIDGNLVDMNRKSEKHIYHVGEKYIDFEYERSLFITLSKALAAQDDNIASETWEQGEGKIVLKDEGMNVLNITGAEFNSAQNGFYISNAVFENGKYTGKQSIIINVDLADTAVNSDGVKEFVTNAQVTVNRTDGENVHNQEANVFDGTIVLWNFFDSSSKDGMYHGIITYGKTSLGSIIAPYAEIHADQNVDGNIIADKIITRAESHRCDFMGPITVKWGEVEETETTEAETTEEPTTEAPTTEEPTTEEPTTEAPTTEEPTTEAPTTEAPTTEAPTTEAPTTEAPTTEAPTTEAPTTEAPTTEAPTTEAPTTEAPTTEVPTTEAPTTQASETSTEAPAEEPTAEAPATEAPTTEAEAPAEAPTSEQPTTKKPDVLGELELEVKQDNEPVRDEDFVLKDSEGNVQGEFTTDEDGKITIPNLEAGDYTLEHKPRPGSVLGDDISGVDFTVEGGERAKGTITIVTDPNGKKSMVLGDLVYENSSSGTPILGISDMPRVFGIIIMGIGAMMMVSSLWLTYRRKRV